MVLDTLKELLEVIGVDVLTARSGSEAINICKQHPDLDKILLDVRMEGLSGLEAAKIIREEGIEVQITFMSGDESGNTRMQAIQDENHPFLRKPISLASLRDFVNNHLKPRFVDR